MPRPPFHLRHLLLTGVFLALSQTILWSRVQAWSIPGGNDIDTIRDVVKNQIPQYLNENANCGWPVEMAEKAGQTKVTGLPLTPKQWRGVDTGATGQEYNGAFMPEDTKGFVFSVYKENPECKEIYTKDEPPCRKPEDCPTFKDKVNAEMRYPVQRNSECEVHDKVLEYNDDGSPALDADGNQLWHCGVRTAITATDQDAAGNFTSPDCHTCPPSYSECDPSFVTATVHAGDKYKCTGDYTEQQKGELMVDYGWVWKADQSGPDYDDMPDRCKEFWTASEKKEHPNAIECKGYECRSGENVPFPPEPFEPVKATKERRYQAYYRRYIAHHTLADIPGTVDKESDYPVNVACYDWYAEPDDLDPPASHAGDMESLAGKPANPNARHDLNCIADDLKIKTDSGQEEMKKRKLEGSAEFNLNDSPMKNEPEWRGGYTLDPDGVDVDDGQQPNPKPYSRFLTKPLAGSSSSPNPNLPYGETPKYVEVLDELEKRFEGTPPTVEVMLPFTQLDQDLKIEPPTSLNSSESSVPLTDFVLPLKAGLEQTVRDAVHSAVLSQVAEEPIPVVIPLLSDSEIQVALTAWQGWKHERELAGKDTGGAGALIGKLQDYRKQILAFRKLRASLPQQLASALKQRAALAAAIDGWINSRLGLYRSAVGAGADFVTAWIALKQSMQDLRDSNSRYCKNDVSTPSLYWLELAADFKVPESLPKEMPPQHLVFDFSNVVLSGLNGSAFLRIPVLQPVQVAFVIPAPPSPLSDDDVPTLPDLPPVPDLPEVDEGTIKSKDTTTLPPFGSFPYDKVIEDLNKLTSQIVSLKGSYDSKLWILQKHDTLECPTFGADGCTFPEIKLWHSFMRIWSPIGAFLTPDEPVAPGIIKNPFQAPDCKGSEPCLLREQRARDGVRVTFPTTKPQTQPFDELRTTMREQTIDPDTGDYIDSYNQPLFDASVDQLFDSYAVPPAFKIDEPAAPAPPKNP